MAWQPKPLARIPRRGPPAPPLRRPRRRPRFLGSDNAVAAPAVSAVSGFGGVVPEVPASLSVTDALAVVAIMRNVAAAAAGAMSKTAVAHQGTLLAYPAPLPQSISITAPGVSAVGAVANAATTRAVRVGAPPVSAVAVPGQVQHIP